LYVVVVLSGATFSSLGIIELREDPQHPLGTTWGTPNGLRTDEFLTLTSIELNVMSLGHSSHSPLTESPDLTFMVSSGQPFETILFFENNLLRLGPWLPDTMLFAAVRGLSFLILALTLPRLLRRIGGATRPLSWFGYGLVVLAPTSVWWSFTPVRIAAIASLGSYLLVVARSRLAVSSSLRQRAFALWLAGVGGISLARLATYYVPWGLTIGLPLVVAAVSWLLWSRPRRAGLLSLAVGAGTGGLLLALTFWENRETLRATLGTVYPGLRRASGDAVDAFHLFGAPGLWQVRGGETPVLENNSEIASAFLVCGLWALLVALMRRPTRTPPSEQRAAAWGLGVSAALWLSWCTVSWGGVGAHVPLLNLVTPPRAAQTVGYSASLLLVLVLSRAEHLGRRGSLIAAVACALATAYGVADLRHALPGLSTTDVWISSGGVAVCVVAVSMWPRWFTVAPVCLLLAWSMSFVNPVQFGLGDMRATDAAEAARALGDRARADGMVIASDSPFVSALLVSNGAPALTGWQIAGPDQDQWRLLDPSGSKEEMWNRGASYLLMSFAGAPGSTATMAVPSPDMVVVTVDPCGLPAGLRVGMLISQADLDLPCLKHDSTFTWVGVPQYVYTVQDPKTS